MLKTRLLFCILIFCQHLHSQDFSYTRYDIKDGLAGSSVFCAAQDKEGFMWFGTESGLSRFDGVHFKNFTTEDGLPDNEIIGLFCDSKGRMWLLPFRKSICYYYKGKLHTQQNDSLLSRLQITSNVFFMAEDKQGNLALAENFRIHLLKDTSIRIITVTGGRGISAIGIDSSDTFLVYSSAELFHIVNDSLVSSSDKRNYYNMGEIAIGKNFFVSQKITVPKTSGEFAKINLTSFNTGMDRLFKSTPGHISFSILTDSLFSDNTNNGATIYNCNNAIYREHHLSGKSISSVFYDDEQNIWFCTQREGIYKLNSPFVSGYRFKGINDKPLGVHSLAWHKNNLWVGTEESYVFTFNPKTGKSDLQPYTNDISGGTRNATKVLLQTKNNDLLIGLQQQVLTVSGLANSQSGSLKDITQAYDNNVLVSTSYNVSMMDVTTLKGVDIIWRGRATTAHYSNELFYIGTLEGLYTVTKQKEKFFTGNDDPLLKSRIAAIRETPDNVLWIATYDRGIIQYKNRKVIAHITKEQGLSSNICRCLFLRGNQLWVGTDKGLNKIAIEEGNCTITKYTVADGLVSDFINCVYAGDSLVYVGTPEGISYFDDKKISQQAPCLLRMSDVIVSGISIFSDVGSFILKRRQNNIRFEYAGISYRSGGEMLYRYRLSGLDTGWRMTKENFLSYPTLLPGHYIMDLQAINKFGIESEIISIPFSIEKFWWEKTWVQILVITVILFIVSIFMNRRIKQVRLREKEKNLLREKISLQEQMALKAQMNPHFIFNSLNSIQHYVLDKDIVGANKYIAGFSRLIRLTLDNSSKPEISIEEEMTYLSQYLEMEKIRFDGFNYAIDVDKDLSTDEIRIVPMLIQPIVENAIWHGLQNQTGEKNLTIRFYKKDEQLVCEIEDNGIGVIESKKRKLGMRPAHRSLGIVNIHDRLTVLNEKYKMNSSLNIIDKSGLQGNKTGTLVTLRFNI